jgi:hypothetical protein
MVVYVNYFLIPLQLKYLEKLQGDWRLLICDNTPNSHYRPLDINDDRVRIFRQEFGGIDGEKHGGALDLLVGKAESDIIGICDSDFFWLKEDILLEVCNFFEGGIKCVGAELYYEDFEKVNKRYPERAGYLAPCVFGMFVDKTLAQSETFVVSGSEANDWYETGWRLRKKIIDQEIPCHIYPAIKLPQQKKEDISWFFGNEQEIVGLHLVKGSGRRATLTNQIEKMIAMA